MARAEAAVPAGTPGTESAGERLPAPGWGGRRPQGPRPCRPGASAFLRPQGRPRYGRAASFRGDGLPCGRLGSTEVGSLKGEVMTSDTASWEGEERGPVLWKH